MKQLNAVEFMNLLPEIMKKGGAICHRAEFPLVHIGLDSQIDFDYCKANKIPIFEVKRAGGAIVSNIGDFDFVIVNKYTLTDTVPALLRKIVALLHRRNLTAEISENDLLVEGYKVASYSYRSLPGGVYTAIHISMSVDMELIKNICKKEMKKVPKGLNDFGIYEEDILKLL